MKKQPQITDATREAFIQAFCEFYSQRPIEQITVKDIAARAGYSRTTFYNYFRDPYDLLNYIQRDIVGFAMESITNNIRQGLQAEQFLRTFVEIIGSKEQYLQVFINNCHDASFVGLLKAEAIPTLLEAFGRTEDVQARFVLEFYISGLMDLIGCWLRDPQGVALEELAELVQKILEDGIAGQLRT